MRKNTFTGLRKLIAVNYGKRLAQAIELAKLPKDEARAKVAKALGISVQAVGQVLTSTSETKALTAQNNARAARFLKVDPHWLATGEGVPRPDTPSAEALEFAKQFDALSEDEKRWWRTLLIAAKRGVSDDYVGKHLPLPPTDADATTPGRKRAKH